MDMTKLNKRAVDGLAPLCDRDIFAWDGEVRGFGVRVKPSGVKTYLIQYRNADGRTRRMVIGKHGILTTEEARDLARQQDRKSTRLNSSHVEISYAVFCLKKKKINSRMS